MSTSIKKVALPAFAAVVLAFASYSAVTWEKTNFAGASGTPADPNFTHMVYHGGAAHKPSRAAGHVYLEISKPDGELRPSFEPATVVMPAEAATSALSINVRAKFALDPGHYVGPAKLGHFIQSAGVEKAAIELIVEPGSGVLATPIPGGYKFEMPSDQVGSGVWMLPEQVLTGNDSKTVKLRVGSVSREVYAKMRSEDDMGDWLMFGGILMGMGAMAAIGTALGANRQRFEESREAVKKMKAANR